MIRTRRKSKRKSSTNPESSWSIKEEDNNSLAMHSKSEKKFNRGLMIGRFQPFHNGHLALAKQILNECNEIIIAIGSAQFNYIYKDPFTAGERISMIHSSLVDSGFELSRCHIIPISNDENNARWFAYLKSMVPSFDAVYSGNKFVAKLIQGQADLVLPNFTKINKYNGTFIRSSIARNHRWEHLVPPAVAATIKELDGIHRIKILYESDSFPQRW
jgi:nicotinamide-nucleotide adenylyltransferase